MAVFSSSAASTRSPRARIRARSAAVRGSAKASSAEPRLTQTQLRKLYSLRHVARTPDHDQMQRALRRVRKTIAMPLNVVEVMAHAVLNMAKAVAAQMLAAVPARDDDHVIGQTFAFEHLQDDLPGPAFAVIVLERGAIGKHDTPGVVRGLGVFLAAFEGLQKGVHRVAATCRPAADRISGSAVGDDAFKLFHLPGAVSCPPAPAGARGSRAGGDAPRWR